MTAEPTFDVLLRRYRRTANLTQEELAERSGLSVRIISTLESGVRHRPRKDTIRLLVEALQLPAEDRTFFEQSARRLGKKDSVPSASGSSVESSSMEQPTGRVRVFLIADVRGYTTFSQERGDEAAARLAGILAKITREVVWEHQGEVVELRGDEVLAVFDSARQALRAAVALQRRFTEISDVDPSLPLNVGMGLDAGEAVPVEQGYRGRALNLAARLSSMANRGEILVGEAVMHLAGTVPGLAYLPRGEAHIKGIAEPVPVIYVAADSGPFPSPPPPNQQIHMPSTLPAQITSFVGRQREINEITALLQQESIRLLTLTGPGGIGKTRLAVQCARQLVNVFPGGVVFVSLAPISDPALVAQTIATSLQVRETAGQSLIQAIANQIRNTQVLLILDNYEHLLEAAEVAGDLLAACSSLKILATSRTVLHLSGEHSYPVWPLPMPEPASHRDIGAVSGCDAVILFVQRAQAARPDFVLSDNNVAAVTEICQRLDGLPLAIELAAARIRLFPAPALLQRLSSRLKLLMGGARDLPARHQTLRAAIDWSYNLLDECEQQLFARLAVFSGGCTLEAAETVCGEGLAMDVLDGIASLVDKSLLDRDRNDKSRFVMLETIREYATLRLAERNETDQLRRLHAEYYLARAEEVDLQQRGGEQTIWAQYLDEEQDNLRAALDWSVEAHEPGYTVRLVCAQLFFWMMRQYVSEGRRWSILALDLVGEDPNNWTSRARILSFLGSISRVEGNLEQARRLLEDSLSLTRILGDPVQLVSTLQNLGAVALEQGDLRQTQVLWEEALVTARQAGNPRLVAIELGALGNLARHQGDSDRAYSFLVESVDLIRSVGGTVSLAWFLSILAQVELDRGEFGWARSHAREALQRARDGRYPREEGAALNTLAEIALARDDLEEAQHWVDESLTLMRERGQTSFDVFLEATGIHGLILAARGNDAPARDLLREAVYLCQQRGRVTNIPTYMEALAMLHARGGQERIAAQLVGAAETLKERMEVSTQSEEFAYLKRSLEVALKPLYESTWNAAREEGRALSYEQAIDLALGGRQETEGS